MIDTNEIAKEFRLTHWAGIVREREESGVSIRAFCENSGFPENRYFYWQKKLRKAACEEMAKAQGETPCTSLTQPVFAEVKLPGRSPLPPASGNLNSNICIEAGGVRVIAGSEYPIEKLVEMFGAVSRTCC